VAAGRVLASAQNMAENPAEMQILEEWADQRVG